MIGKKLKKKNNLRIALNVLYAKKEKIYPVYVSKYNSNCEKQVILLMITNGEEWHYLVVKKLLALLRAITSKHHGDFYCLNCLHSLATENKRESHKKACKNKDFCNVVMTSQETETLEFNQYKKSDKVSVIIYADLQLLVEKIDVCKNNTENSFTIKVGEHFPSGFSMSTVSSFKSIKVKHDVYRSKDCMKKFCEYLREHPIKIINFKKKKLSY